MTTPELTYRISPIVVPFQRRSLGKARSSEELSKRLVCEMEWLHYNEAEDSAVCFTCWKSQQGVILDPHLRPGFYIWKDSPESFRRHEESKCHKEAHDIIVTIPNTLPSVGKMLSTIHSKKQYESRKAMMVLENIQYLGRQGIAFRGHDECDGNFIQLFKLGSKDYPSLIMS